ncbi:MerR family transcriptional regulator [Psychrobacillus soli]|uniref:MerR family transcriptional regulator n=1 Tax=Psychrobacillus soli TaxID=1543965 RepID=A0A544TB70_9BACI|nr:MerR family transcriptional regulator [Psychrobacillus soli]TQR14704.1 MerR family transcriptional regulator [Psychrobacillus soli]
MTQSRKGGLYTIQQVADVTGLSKQVIRKWEERYELVQPNRLENGYRIYSEQDVKTLLKVKALSEQGYSLKQAVLLLKEAHDSVEVELEIESKEPYAGFNDFVFQLLEKGTYCDEIELNYILQQGYHRYGLEKFLKQVILPFLHEVGNRWEKEEWDEYQESVSSMVVRDFLVQIRRNYRYREDAPLVMGACLPNEYHEIPLHILLLQFMMKGWKAILVGSSPAPGAIETLVKKLKPKIVLLSATTTIPFERNPKLLHSLDQFAAEHSQTEFYIGGAGAMQYFACKNLKSIHLANSLEDVLEGSKNTI